MISDPDSQATILDNQQHILDALIANDFSKILKPNAQTEAFLEDDEFWENELKDDRDIPLKALLERDPTFTVVGKEIELLTGKLAIVKAMKLEYRRQVRFQELSELLLTIAYLKTSNHRSFIENQEQRLIESGVMDWEAAYGTILQALSDTYGVDLPETLKIINEQREKLILTLRIPEELISEKLHEEMANPVTFLLLGDMGAGKSFIQRRLEKWRQNLYGILDLRGYDRLLLRDQNDSNKAYLRTLPGGEGQALIRHYDARTKTRQGLEKWIRRGVIALLVFPPVYKAVVLGLEMAKYQWGVLDDINPLVDVGVWINDNFHWVALYAVLFVYSQAEKWVRDSGYLERMSMRPQWVVDSSRSESIIIGDIDREKIVGSYDVDFKRPPQLGLVELPNWLQTDGKSLIIEQLSDLSHDAQSIFAELIQEREFSIADRGEYTTTFLSFLSVGQNPHVMKDLIPPLKDRLKLGSGCVVVNAVDKHQSVLSSHDDFIAYTLSQNRECSQFAAITGVNEVPRHRRIERKFMAFLKDFREKAGAKPLQREALEFLVKTSSAYADDLDSIIINREFLGYLNSLMMQSTFTGHDCITKEDCAMAVITTRTPDQKILARKIATRDIRSSEIDHRHGTVNLLALSKYVELSDDVYLQEVAEGNSIGYVVQLRARMSQTGQKGVYLQNSPFSQEQIEKYTTQLEFVLDFTEVEFRQFSTHIDLCDVMCDDETLLTAMYIACRSAIEKKPIHDSLIIACQLSSQGDVISLPRLNQRLITCIEHIKTAFVLERDLESKIDQAFYDALSAAAEVDPFKLISVTNAEQLYREATQYESTLSESQQSSLQCSAETMS